MDNARQAAAAGFIRCESIPLLALTDESFYHGKLSWTLRFPVPPPDTSGSARRFSSTVTFQQGPHSAEALDGALRLANPFSYTNEASHVLFNSPFLRLPDLSVLRPPRIESYETPSPPEPAVQDWLNNRAPRLIPSRHRTYTPVPLGLVDYFNSNIHLPQVSMLIASHQCHNEDATAEARKHADTNVICLLLPFYESFLLIQSCLVTDFPTFHLPVLHLRLYCGGPWIWGWQNCTSRAQKLEPHLLVKVHSASAPWLNHCRSQCNIRLAAEIDIVIFECNKQAWESRGWAIAALKLGLGKQRLSNSYLKTGAGKIAGAEVEQ